MKMSGIGRQRIDRREVNHLHSAMCLGAGILRFDAPLKITGPNKQPIGAGAHRLEAVVGDFAEEVCQQFVVPGCLLNYQRAMAFADKTHAAAGIFPTVGRTVSVIVFKRSSTSSW